MLTLWLSFALAAEPAAVAIDAITTDPGPLPAEGFTPMSADELLTETWHRMDLRDYEGARIVAEQVIARDPSLKLKATSAIAASYEFDGDPARAMALYREILAAEPAGELAPHMHMRIAECLGALERYDEALAEVAILGDPAGWPYLDEKKIRLLRGSWWLAGGDREAGTEELERALTGIGSDEAPYYQALARAAIARDLVARADALAFDDRQRRTVKHLRERTALILDAEQQVVAAIDLKEPEWALEGLLVLGGAFEKVGDDLLGVPAPRKIRTAVQKELYATTLTERVQVLYVKAGRYYEQGLDLAVRLSWKSARIGELERALSAVRAKTVAAPPPG